MANTKQARKRARQAEKHRTQNTAMRSRMRTAIKKTTGAIEAGNRDEAGTRYAAAVPAIDAMARRGLIHKNKAARHKSRLNQRIRQL